MPLYGDDAPLPDDGALAEIAALGATHVALVVAWSQPDVRARRLAPRRGLTPGDERVKKAMAAARAAGLAVVLFPIVDVQKRAPGQWRGTLAPADVDAWWRGYEAFVLHYAALAADGGAAALVVGSELGSTEAWRDRWYHLLSRVGRVYRGPLLYSANWDHYEAVSFWDRLDAIGVTGYFELASRDDAGEAELAAAWQVARDRLVGFARAKKKPLWLTEVGYPSRDGAARQPWNYESGRPIDLEEQRRCYAALVTAWGGEPALAGLLIWQWYGAGGPRDDGYTPRGKPALPVLRRWFGGAPATGSD